MPVSSTQWDYKLHRQLAELGPSMGGNVREVSLGLYTPMHPSEPPYPVLRDISYGPHPRQRLDVHCPTTPSAAPRAVFVFVHGGGFSSGDKRREGEPFYDNIARWAVESDFVGVNITYRYAPEFTFPSGAEDVAAALRWVESNIAEHGGDPASIVVMGHSAGAAHVASFVPRIGKSARRLSARSQAR